MKMGEKTMFKDEQYFAAKIEEGIKMAAMFVTGVAVVLLCVLMA